MVAFSNRKGVKSFLRIVAIGFVLFGSGGCQQQDEATNNEKDKTQYALAAGDVNVRVNRSSKQPVLMQEISTVSNQLLNAPVAPEDAFGTNSSGKHTAVRTIVAQQQIQPPAAAEEPPQKHSARAVFGRFFEKLRAIETGRSKQPVTILHLGDRHIAADHFSGDLREQFQSRFGNAGRGMLNPGLFLARGVKFERGGDWQSMSCTGTAPGPYGLTGAKIMAEDSSSWMRLTTKETQFEWSELTFESGEQNGTALIGLDGDMKQVPTSGKNQSWRTVRIERPAKEVLIKPAGDGRIILHSITLGANNPGVKYMNFGLPGATMATPLNWDEGYLRGDLKRIAPDLIILSYGTEEGLQNTLDIADYEAKANAAISRLRRAAPEAALLIISPPDIARPPKFAAAGQISDVCRALSREERVNYDQRIKNEDPRLARWHPPLHLAAVRRSLRRFAAEHKAFFWDWSKLMGGPCGIHAWVHSKPPLATKDHLHLTEEGSKRSARQLFRELMTGYDAYIGEAPATTATVKK